MAASASTLQPTIITFRVRLQQVVTLPLRHRLPPLTPIFGLSFERGTNGLAYYTTLIVIGCIVM